MTVFISTKLSPLRPDYRVYETRTGTRMRMRIFSCSVFSRKEKMFIKNGINPNKPEFVQKYRIFNSSAFSIVISSIALIF